jgi:flagellar basal-body rod modification protein FlgD
MSTVSSVTGSTSTSSLDAALSRVPQKTLDQEDFLKLLVAQMTTQDPLNPTKDTEFAAQMAQFTSLEQTRSMSSEISKMRMEQEFLQANDLLGRIVVLQNISDNSTVQGLVSAVTVEEGTPKIKVGEKVYTLDQVVGVMVPIETTQSATDTASTP